MVDNGRKLIRKKSKRKAILTEAEKINIKSGKISSKSKSKLYHKLDQRFEALIEDLYLISKSDTLKIWRQLKKYQYNSDLLKLAKIFEDLAGSEFTRIYLDKIRSSKNSKGNKVFWLEASRQDKILDRVWKKKKPYYSEKLFQPTNVLRGSKETKKIKDLLMEAYNMKIIPIQEKNAIEKKTIQAIIESIKRKTLKNSKCKTCGFKYSPKCPTCRKRMNNKFQKKIEGKPLTEYVMIQNIDSNSY